MESLHIKATKYTPSIVFYAHDHILDIRGESYPENAAEFYDPLFAWLENYLREPEKKNLTVNIELLYFNSSSSKILLDVFDILDSAAENNREIIVNWIYDKDDEDTFEFGKDFQDDFRMLRFNLAEKMNAA